MWVGGGSVFRCAGWNRKALIDALVLLREAPWSTKPVEEQHGSMAAMHKFHPDLAQGHLALRSFLQSCRFLCTSDDNKLARITAAQVKRLQKRQPSEVRGQHIFIADAMAAARRHIGPAGKLGFAGAQRVLAHAQRSFSTLPSGATSAYAAKAKARASASQKAIASEVAFLKTQQELIEANRAEDIEGQGIKHRLSEVRFNDADWDRLVEIWNGEVAHVLDAILSHMAGLCTALQLPSGAEIERVNKAKPKKPPAEDKSDFVRLMATHRSFFAGKVIMTEEVGDAVGFKLIFAIQNPLRAFFLHVFPVDREYPFIEPGLNAAQLQQRLRHISHYEFEWLPATFITDRGIGDIGNFNNLWVFEDVVFKGATRLGGSVLPKPLDFYAARHT